MNLYPTAFKINFMELLNIFKPTVEREESFEEIKRNYQPAMALCERQYDQDVAAQPEKAGQRPMLETHNEIVLGYAAELVKAHNLSEADKAAVYLAVIFHDSGKLAANLMSHHLTGKEYAERLLQELPPIKQGGETIAIAPELKEKVLQAIERHMNHPFLVKANNGQRFPEPENDIDRIVFDADMMANVGFKNIGFRLTSEKYLNEDIAEASQKGLPALEETFNNVMEGVRVLDEAVLSPPAKAQIKRLVGAAEQIFNYLKVNRIFQAIQDKYSKNREFNFKTIGQAPDGAQSLEKELNSAIEKAAQALRIDEKVVKNFIM